MTQKNNHWCLVCGTGYYACDSCRQISSFTPWRAIADTMEHYKIHLILTDYNNGIIDKDEAGRKLAKVTYTAGELKKNVQTVIQEITGTTAKSKTTKPKILKPKRCK